MAARREAILHLPSTVLQHVEDAIVAPFVSEERMVNINLLALGASVLKGPWPTLSSQPASKLWQDGQPTVVYSIRRFG